MSTFDDDLGLKALEFFHTVRELDSMEKIVAAVVAELKGLGFDYITWAALPGPAQNPLKGVLINTRPDEYVRRYVERDYAKIDPVITELKHSMRPFSWGDVGEHRKPTKTLSRIMDEGREFGMTDGLTIPLVSHDGAISVFCPCGDRPDLHPRVRSAAELIAMAANQAMRRLALDLERRAPPEAVLTGREREVLSWVAAGETDTEIGDRLRLSSTTVTKHVANAMRKLNVGKRTMAVIEAIRLKEIKV